MDLIDNEQTREVTVEEAKTFSREINSTIDISKLPKDPYFETSSLSGRNVTEVFEFIFNHCLPLTDAERKAATTDSGIVDLSKPLEGPGSGAGGKKCC